MHSPNTATLPRRGLDRHHTLGVIDAICLNYIGNFSHYANFGFYEDDYLLALPIFTWLRSDLWQHVGLGVHTTWPQGDHSNDTLTFAISRFDSLPLLYATVFLSSCFCLFVLHGFLRRFPRESASFIATALFCLYPVAKCQDYNYAPDIFFLGAYSSITAVSNSI
jgi:hypothetical protein